MRFLQTTRLFYVVYTVYTFLILLISDYPVKYALSGLAVMWLLYLIVFVGYKSLSKKYVQEQEYKEATQSFFFSAISDWTAWQYFLNGAVCWVCTVLVSKYYTGKGVAQVVSGLFGSGNAYGGYQDYFQSANIATFSLQKIPYILMLSYMTIMLFWSVVAILQLTPKIRGIQYIYVVSIVLSYLYFGVARGTNFELYTVFILLSYCVLNRQNNKKEKQKLNSKKLIVIGIMGCILVALFLSIVGARGGKFSYMICDEIQYKPQRLFSRIFPNLSIVLKSMFSYLGFGIYTIGVSFWDIVPDSVSSGISFLFPGYEMVNGTTIVSELSSLVKIGVRWIPDIIFMISNHGFIVTMIVFFVIGQIVSTVQTAKIPNLLKELISIILFIQMLSFPVGNFIVVSTPNKVLVAFVIVCVIASKVRFVFNGKSIGIRKIRIRF